MSPESSRCPRSSTRRVWREDVSFIRETGPDGTRRRNGKGKFYGDRGNTGEVAAGGRSGKTDHIGPGQPFGLDVAMEGMAS